MMTPDMISREDLSVLIHRSGLKLDGEQFEALRRSYANLQILADLVRVPRDRRAEPSSVFRVSAAPQGHGTPDARPTPQRDGDV